MARAFSDDYCTRIYNCAVCEHEYRSLPGARVQAEVELGRQLFAWWICGPCLEEIVLWAAAVKRLPDLNARLQRVEEWIAHEDTSRMEQLESGYD